ncbi:MAG: arginine--tRNA ligase, partial [Calditrichaeota bacterium]|nr:arginine--tRNA ligase [Calditrichota bacterium]
DNPVFYVQYAHARIQSILRQPAALEFDLNTGIDISVLKEEAELDILRLINRYPMTLSAVVRGIEPHPLTIYLTELAKAFHTFYAKHRVIGEDHKLTAARLLLCKGVAGMLREVLNLMGVSAPNKM